MGDIYKTLSCSSSAVFTEKRSKFLAFAHPVESIEEAMQWVEHYRKEYYDARHVCWAYRLGGDGSDYRANDDGEPSSTAGKPILGQLLSHELTQIIVIVVRYFGGIQLGTGGLIVAYKSAASIAIEAGEIIERTVDILFTIQFDYLQMNSVMRIIKEENPQIREQQFELVCHMQLTIRASHFPRIRERLLNVEGLRLAE